MGKWELFVTCRVVKIEILLGLGSKTWDCNAETKILPKIKNILV
jgi:hypothetical protein